MENEITKVFNHSPVRIINKDGEPWFCLSDVCKILELNQVSRTKSRLNKDGVTTSKVIDSLGRKQNATFINESNLYKTILQSRKKQADPFIDWVTRDIIPAIRKHGSYALPNANEAQIMAWRTTAEQEMYRRIEVEQQLKIYEKAVMKLSEYGIPKAKFGEISKTTGLPRDIIIGSYIKSKKTPHVSHIDKHLQLLLPLFALEQNLLENNNA